MKNALISVITVVYNARPTLESTIQSVLCQDKNLVEYWIIDGGSTDGSIDLIRKYEHQLAGWCSEPDNGIYDAMNKGIDRANGKWIYFLGGDDTLRPNVLKQIEPYLDPKYSIVFGDVMFDNGHRMRSFLGPRTIFQNTVHHQSAFYNSSLFVNFRYDKSLTIVSEYDVHLRLYIQKAYTRYVSMIVADCATGGASSELSKSLTETNQVRARYIKNKWKNKLLSCFLRLYYIQKKIRYLIYGHRV
ncbi:glycosyltransferase family 2 protein [Spirosoma endbachense]|uniref:Glycosyltransferase n=1 Tax=Spirosoma endbachense TaxID=2666025 RepID=A0A6P1W8X5_9BACT|nr:glycosyltransferase family 2 protein [Spirosoma endbachense]QHW00498.1 glycosyltransferase [Spirosoma endbachense]